jgi:hypothetical protein
MTVDLARLRIDMATTSQWVRRMRAAARAAELRRMRSRTDSSLASASEGSRCWQTSRRARLGGGERTGPIEPVAGLVGRLGRARREGVVDIGAVGVANLNAFDADAGLRIT